MIRGDLCAAESFHRSKGTMSYPASLSAHAHMTQCPCTRCSASRANILRNTDSLKESEFPWYGLKTHSHVRSLVQSGLYSTHK